MNRTVLITSLGALVGWAVFISLLWLLVHAPVVVAAGAVLLLVGSVAWSLGHRGGPPFPMQALRLGQRIRHTLH